LLICVDDTAPAPDELRITCTYTFTVTEPAARWLSIRNPLLAMRLWRSEGREIAIYSSGSEMAQRRLFESTAVGDLTPLIKAFFDTRVGAKVEVNSYTKIAQALGQPASSILFVSDVTAELRAARAAGLDVVLSVRPGNSPQTDAHLFPAVSTLTGI